MRKDTTIDETDHLRIRELRYARMLPGGWDKKFIASLSDRIEEDLSALTERQSYNLARMAWKYRKQISPSAAPRSEPIDPAKKRKTNREMINQELKKREKEDAARKERETSRHVEGPKSSRY